MIPPPYPRIPHLAVGRGTRDDLFLDAAAASDLLGSEVVVEEKLDGANVVIWFDESDTVKCAPRGGPDAMDRAGQVGPLRAWLALHEMRLRSGLPWWPAVYAEWMLLAHSVRYTALPSYLVVLDLWDPNRGFAGVDERDAWCEAAGLVSPPRLWTGAPGSVAFIERLIGTSVWGSEAAEGVVVRRLDVGVPRMAKLLRADFRRLQDKSWRSRRPRNRLAEGEISFR